MDIENIKKIAEQCGATHKQSLGVYQFYTHELEIFVEKIREELLAETAEEMMKYELDKY